MTDSPPSGPPAPLTITAGPGASLGPLSVEVIPETGDSLKEFSLSSGHLEEKIELSAGRYAVIARRPNGQRLYRSVTVESGRPQTISLSDNMPASPNEFMEPERHRGQVAIDPSTTGTEAKRGILSAQGTPALAAVAARHRLLAHAPPQQWKLRAWYKGGEAKPRQFHLDVGESFLKIRMNRPSCLALGLLNEKGAGPIVMIPPFDEPLSITFPAECLLPVVSRYSGVSTQRALVALVTPDDPHIADLLTALGSVSVEHTDAIWGQNADALRYVYEKYDDPAKALIGAHYLLRFLPDKLPIAWADNLSRLLPDAADGPVIAAWLRLKSQSEEVQKIDPKTLGGTIDRLFSDALSRPIAWFARTRRLLIDGLPLAPEATRQVASRDKPEASDYLDYGAHAGGLEAFWGRHPFGPGSRQWANEPPSSDLAILHLAEKSFARVENTKHAAGTSVTIGGPVPQTLSPAGPRVSKKISKKNSKKNSKKKKKSVVRRSAKQASGKTASKNKKKRAARKKSSSLRAVTLELLRRATKWKAQKRKVSGGG